MSTKIERTAYNFTKLAALVDPLDTSNGLYEAAKDNGLVMINGTTYGIGQFVFIPAKEWTAKAERFNKDEKFYGIEAHSRYGHVVKHWYDLSQIHKY